MHITYIQLFVLVHRCDEGSMEYLIICLAHCIAWISSYIDVSIKSDQHNLTVASFGIRKKHNYLYSLPRNFPRQNVHGTVG